MRWKQLWARKSLETLQHEMAGEHRLHRVLGPVSLTSLGVGMIIGAGIFAMTGRVAAEDAGPSIMLSFVVAGIGCAFAALCYAEFAAMAPVAGSAYTYTYATLGELWAWIIGWDLILEYAMSCGVVASHWASYLNELIYTVSAYFSPDGLGYRIIPELLSDPFTPIVVNGVSIQPWFNLPAVLIMAVVTVILVIGVRESALTNAILVVIKVGVVLFVIAVGWGYTHSENWTAVPVTERKPTDIKDWLSRNPEFEKQVPPERVREMENGKQFLEEHPEIASKLTDSERALVASLPAEGKKWGLLGALGLKHMLQPLDDSLRSPFMPFGLSGIMVGAALVFFAYIGFDSISTHAEEAINPKRDLPIGIIGSLVLCTILYIFVSAIITGMEPYPQIDTGAAVAVAFTRQGLKFASALISVGALAGMTSVLLVTFQSQARIFLAMARDGLLPHSIFGVVHPRFRTPHISTILTGIVICLVAAFTPVRKLEEMVNIGTLMAFILVCASVLSLRITRPNVERPFRTPLLFVVAPLGILVNLAMTLFLPIDTWVRLAVWLGLGMVIYLLYSQRHSVMGQELMKQFGKGLSPVERQMKD